MIHILKSALKYSRSNLGNQQGDLQWKIAKKKLCVTHILYMQLYVVQASGLVISLKK